ncbi:hypothetical protein U1Q18_046884 [Sarracenia purpurea var. burkii]
MHLWSVKIFRHRRRRRTLTTAHLQATCRQRSNPRRPAHHPQQTNAPLAHHLSLPSASTAIVLHCRSVARRRRLHDCRRSPLLLFAMPYITDLLSTSSPRPLNLRPNLQQPQARSAPSIVKQSPNFCRASLLNPNPNPRDQPHLISATTHRSLPLLLKSFSPNSKRVSPPHYNSRIIPQSLVAKSLAATSAKP